MSITPSQRKFADFWGDVAERWGYSPDAARVQSFLLLTDDPHNAAELAELLELPKARVRKAIDILLAWETIEAVEVEGERGDFYLCELEAWEIIWRLCAHRGTEELAEIIPALEAMAAASKRESGAASYAYKRMAEAIKLCRFVATMIKDAQKLPALHLQSVTQLGSRVARVLGFTRD
jgi:DNA-binding transcriptional regulator GbsR (MarR family)